MGPPSVDTASPSLPGGEAVGCGDTCPLPASCSDPCAGGGLSILSSMQAGTWVAWEGATACSMSLAGWQGWDRVIWSETGAGLVPLSPPALPRPMSKMTRWSRSMSRLGCRSYTASRRETPRNPVPRVSPCECWWQSPIQVRAWGGSSVRASCGKGQEDGEGSTACPKGVSRGARHLVRLQEQGCSAGSRRLPPCGASSPSRSCGLGDPRASGAAAGPRARFGV